MKFKSRGVVWPLGALLMAPVLASAATQTFRCGMTHFVRSGGTELASTTLSIRNADPGYTATVLQLTIRDGGGQIVHDSGPATATPLPLNTDFPNTYPGGRDIGQVPPGGGVYLRSNHIWGNNGLPSGAAGNETGQQLSASIVLSKDGMKSALSVHATPRIRSRVPGPTPGSFVETDTRASGNTVCEASP